ncbi:MAG: PAS domain-containing protein [Myxococcota bacterium]
MWIFRDETERRSHEAEIREAKRFLTSILENLPDMVFVKDAETLAFVRFNKAGEDLLGVGRDALIGRTDFDLFPPEQAEHFVARDLALAAGALRPASRPSSPTATPCTRRRSPSPTTTACRAASCSASRATSPSGGADARGLRKPPRRPPSAPAAPRAVPLQHEPRAARRSASFAEMLSHEAIGKLTERQRVCVDDIGAPAVAWPTWSTTSSTCAASRTRRRGPSSTTTRWRPSWPRR